MSLAAVHLQEALPRAVFAFARLPRSAPAVAPAEPTFAAFRDAVEALARTHRIVDLDTLADEAADARPCAALTLEGGWHDWFEDALPWLQQRGHPATVFVPQHRLDGAAGSLERAEHLAGQARGTWPAVASIGLPALSLSDAASRRRACVLLKAALRPLAPAARDAALTTLEAACGLQPPPARFDAGDVARIAALGFAVGASWADVGADGPATARLRERLAQMRLRLEHASGQPVAWLAWAGAAVSSDAIDAARAAGFRGAVATGRAPPGAVRAADARWSIPRVAFDPAHGSLEAQWRSAARRALPKRPLRVVVVESSVGFGGSHVALREAIRHLSPQDVRLHVIGHAGTPAQAPAAALGDVQTLPAPLFAPARSAAWLARLRWRPLKRVCGFALGRVDDACNRLPYYWRLRAALQRLDADVVHGNNEPFSNREAARAAQALGLPYVQHLRGGSRLDGAARAVLRSAARIVPVSRWIAMNAVRAGVDAARIDQIYDGIDAEAFRGRTMPQDPSLRAELGLAEATPLVAITGMLMPWKGQALFLDAVQRLVAGGRAGAAHFLVIGGPPTASEQPYADALQAQARAAGLAGRCHLLGQRADMAALTPQIDVIVSASLDPEPLGLVMLEAMAAGCVFVGPRHGAAAELAPPGSDGLLFEPRDAASLAEAIGRGLALARAQADGHAARAPIDVPDAAATAQRLLQTWRDAWQAAPSIRAPEPATAADAPPHWSPDAERP